MPPAELSPLALLWRAVWRTTLAGALLAAGYGALLLGVTEFSTYGWKPSVPSATLLGAALYLIYGAAVGVVGGLALGLGLAVAWRKRTPAPTRARPLGLLLGLVPTALLAFLTTGGDLRPFGGDNGGFVALIFVVLPASLGLGWMWREAGALARWRRSQRAGHPEGAPGPGPIPER